MMAMSKKMLGQYVPGEIEVLLPWHAAGTLSARDARRVEEALARDPELAKQYAVIREEYAETIHLNESLGAPSMRAMQKLFTAIDGEPERKPSGSIGLSARISEFFASLSPRTLATSAALGALALLLQAGVIGAVLMKGQTTGQFQTASYEAPNGPITRDVGSSLLPPPRVLVRFTPDTKVADISALLDGYQASIVDGKGGMFHLQFNPMTRRALATLMTKLQNEKIVSSAVAAQ